jgi:hypothetical protein
MDVGEASEGTLDVGLWTLNAWKRLRKMQVNLAAGRKESSEFAAGWQCISFNQQGTFRNPQSKCPRLAKTLSVVTTTSTTSEASRCAAAELIVDFRR